MQSNGLGILFILSFYPVIIVKTTPNSTKGAKAIALFLLSFLNNTENTPNKALAKKDMIMTDMVF